MNKGEITVILADDHNLVRNGILSLLDGAPGIYIIGEASNGRELVTRYFEYKPDVVVTDISMPLQTGLIAAEKIRSRDKSARILFLSVFDSEDYVYKALKVGALGLINKSISKGELILAIENVYAGRKYFGRNYSEEKLKGIMEKYDGEKVQDNKSDVDITPREMETLRLICDGLQSSEIAERLCIGKRTIDTYRSNLMKKFNVSNSSQLVNYALTKKIID